RPPDRGDRLGLEEIVALELVAEIGELVDRGNVKPFEDRALLGVQLLLGRALFLRLPEHRATTGVEVEDDVTLATNQPRMGLLRGDLAGSPATGTCHLNHEAAPKARRGIPAILSVFDSSTAT